jgi:hypothetical protein
MTRSRQRWPVDQIVQPVPDRLAAGEFACRTVEWRHPAWARAPHRLRQDGAELAWLLRVKGARRSRPPEGRA